MVYNGLTLERNIAINIIGLFEDLLAEHDIYIPSEDREGEPDEAYIYGCEYYDLEDSITELLEQYSIEKK